MNAQLPAARRKIRLLGFTAGLAEQISDYIQLLEQGDFDLLVEGDFDDLVQCFRTLDQIICRARVKSLDQEKAE